MKSHLQASAILGAAVLCSLFVSLAPLSASGAETLPVDDPASTQLTIATEEPLKIQAKVSVESRGEPTSGPGEASISLGVQSPRPTPPWWGRGGHHRGGGGGSHGGHGGQGGHGGSAPVPEPSTWAGLALLGLCLGAVLLRKAARPMQV